MTWYPIFLDMRGRKVLVAGAGRVALRKAIGLTMAGAVVTVISPQRDDGFEKLEVNYVPRKVLASDVNGFSLVFAATDDRATNQSIAEAALELGIPANIADAPEECTFLLPARIVHGDVQVAVSTGGRDPLLAVKTRNTIKKALQGSTTASICVDSTLAVGTEVD